jgi:peptidoglycan/xylan/chitin deacetylase (PgdA/CDA1 family)
MTRRLTISFDNGPADGDTEQVLDALASRNVLASFFVVGDELVKPGYRACLERAKAEGHWICNHTLTHGAPLGSSEDQARVEREIGEMQALMGDLVHADRFFRPNGEGNYGPHLLSGAAARFLAAGGYTVVTWNNVPGDWIEPRDQWPERALETMANQAWSLLVIHDFLVAPMIDTLPRFIDAARERCFEIVQDFPPSCTPMIRGEAQPNLPEICGNLPT